MKVAIRADAALHIGLGHVMRCLTLANALHQRGALVQFVGRVEDASLVKQIVSAGHRYAELPSVTEDIQLLANVSLQPTHAGWLGKSWQDDLTQTVAALDTDQIDWLIVDHYALDARWEREARTFSNNIMVIDDLADRDHDCDLLLDQTLGRTASSYRHLVSSECVILTGSQYVMLRPQFSQWRARSLARRQYGKLEHLLITMGGVDKDNHTAEILNTLLQSALPESCQISVVMNAQSEFLADIQDQIVDFPWQVKVLVDVANMAELMTSSDLCIGTAGMTSWERCCLGLPTLLFIVAENQRDTAQTLKHQGAVLIMEKVSDICLAINEFTHSDNPMSSMSQAASKVTDGSGLDNVISRLELSYA